MLDIGLPTTAPAGGWRSSPRRSPCRCLATSTARAADLLISGGGYGHGVGMSQQGALGYAEHGFTYQAILTHYYTGTALGSAPANAQVRVLMANNKVRKVALETYVRGVVSAEVSASWPLAALEAQAAPAARTRSPRMPAARALTYTRIRARRSPRHLSAELLGVGAVSRQPQ